VFSAFRFRASLFTAKSAITFNIYGIGIQKFSSSIINRNLSLDLMEKRNTFKRLWLITKKINNLKDRTFESTCCGCEAVNCDKYSISTPVVHSAAGMAPALGSCCVHRALLHLRRHRRQTTHSTTQLSPIARPITIPARKESRAIKNRWWLYSIHS